MEDFPINFTAIIIATIANFFLGFIWYTPLFGKVWAKENGFDTTVKATGAQLGKGMAMNVIGNFFLAYVLASNNAAWSFVPGISSMSTAGVIMTSAFFTWLGFFLPVDLNTVAWERKSWKLFGINTAYHFLSLLLAATILTLIK